MNVAALPPCFLRDFSDGLRQQMFFWGQDVLMPTGNFLTERGFERNSSKASKGTSCYRLEWQSGHIELYGACAGWYGRDGGFTFIRPHKRCYIWNSAEETPIPGAWKTEYLEHGTKNEFYTAALPFLDWLIDYERAVLARFGNAYRRANYREYRKVPRAKHWIEPSAALQWFGELRDSPGEVQRPKCYSRRIHG